MSVETAARGRDEVSARLIRAAMKLLEDAPPPDVTSKQIAELAGVNHGQIHHYFGSKDALIAATVNAGTKAISERSLRGGEIFPLPIDTVNRPVGWQSLAYLTATDVRRRPPYEPSTGISAMVLRRAADRDEPPHAPDVLAEVAGAVSMQRGWWFFQDVIEASLQTFEVDGAELRRRVADRSTRLIDPPHSNGNGHTPQPRRRHRISIDSAPAPHGREEVSEQLILAAVDLLADRPPAEVTSKDIASLAGVNHGQIHHYFESKDHLVARAVERDAQLLVEHSDAHGTRFPVPVDTEFDAPMWRTWLHLVVTDEWRAVDAHPSPMIAHMVETLAAHFDRPVTDHAIHAQAAAVHAFELGWYVYRGIIEFAYEALEPELDEVRKRLAEISVRLVDPRPAGV